MKIGSKEIKKYILGYNDLEELFNFLEIEFKETIEAIFNALFILLKNYEKNNVDRGSGIDAFFSGIRSRPWPEASRGTTWWGDYDQDAYWAHD